MPADTRWHDKQSQHAFCGAKYQPLPPDPHYTVRQMFAKLAPGSITENVEGTIYYLCENSLFRSTYHCAV